MNEALQVHGEMELLEPLVGTDNFKFLNVNILLLKNCLPFAVRFLKGSVQFSYISKPYIMPVMPSISGQTFYYGEIKY